MIVKGGSVSGGGLAAHLQHHENDRIELVHVDGLLATDITGAIAELRARAVGVTKKGLLHFQISPGIGEAWGPDQEKAAVAALVKEYGLEGHALTIVRHAKDAKGLGRDDHLHVVATRIRENGRVVDDAFSRVRNEKIARILEFRLGHSLVPGRHNQAVLAQLRKDGVAEVAKWMNSATEVARPVASQQFSEVQQEKRTGILKKDVASAVLTAWRASDNGTAFAAAMTEAGYKLTKGDKPGAIVILDQTGGPHELVNMLGMAMKQDGQKLRAREVREMIEAKAPDLADIITQPIKEARLDAQQSTTFAARPDQKSAVAELRAGGQFSPDSKRAVLKALNGWTSAARKRGQNVQPIKIMAASVKAASSISDLNPDTRRWLTSWLNRQLGITTKETNRDRKNHKPDPYRATARSAASLYRLHAVPRGDMARNSSRTSVLLPAHESDLVRQQKPRTPDAVRRDQLRNHLGASIMNAYTSRDDIIRDFLKEFRTLNQQQSRTPGQEAERLAVADALRSMAHSQRGLERLAGKPDAESIMSAAVEHDRQHIDEQRTQERLKQATAEPAAAFSWAMAAYKTMPDGKERDDIADTLRTMARTDTHLRKVAPNEAEEILTAAKRHNQEWLARLNLAPVGSVPLRTIQDDVIMWQKMAESRPDLVRQMVAYPDRIDIHLTNGALVRDHGGKLTTDEMSPQVAEAMAVGAVQKGWREVKLTGSMEAKQEMATAMIRHGIKVENAELRDFCASLEQAKTTTVKTYSSDREALADARRQPNLTDTEAFKARVTEYQKALVQDAPIDTLRWLKADLCARGEAIFQHGSTTDAATWAAEAKRMEVDHMEATFVARA